MIAFARAKKFLGGRLAVSGAARILKSASAGRVVHVDLGSGGGMEYAWRLAFERGLFDAYLVDPLPEWGTGKGLISGRPGAIQVPFAFGSRDGPAPFFETEMPACSSCLRPNVEALAGYRVRNWFRIKRESTVELRRADTVWREFGFPPPDTVKLDVQGLELECLRGFGSLLDGVVFVEAEARMRRIYEAEPLLSDMQEFMRQQGFYLRHLSPQGPFEGEYLEVNSFWVRASETLDSRRKAIAAAWEKLCGIPRATGLDANGSVYRRN